MTLTFLDSGVLLTGWKGKGLDRDHAIRIMDSAEREFVSSQVVRLELWPKPTYHKSEAELAFYRQHFARLRAEEKLSEDLGNDALALGSRYGLSAADSLNLAAAIRQGTDEFITTESLGKPLFRVSELKVKNLFQCDERSAA